MSGSPRYCDQCGRSLRPLDVPHVERPCSECGKSVYVAEPGEGGGIRVREGDKFTIPAGWLTMSLDPAKSRGRFSRHGVSWFVRQLLIGEMPSSASGLDGLLDRYEREADEVLEASPKLAHLDLESESDAEKAIEIVKADSDSTEWWAMWMAMMAADIRERLRRGETADAVLSACRLQAARSMLVFKSNLEEHVWTGYRHTQLIYDIASAGARTSQETEAIRALRPIFLNLPEDVLHTWVESGVEIGPRIGVTQVEEPLLRALAEYHLSLFERRRKKHLLGEEQRSRSWSNRIQGAVAATTIAGAVVGLLKATHVL